MGTVSLSKIRDQTRRRHVLIKIALLLHIFWILFFVDCIYFVGNRDSGSLIGYMLLIGVTMVFGTVVAGLTFFGRNLLLKFYSWVLVSPYYGFTRLISPWLVVGHWKRFVKFNQSIQCSLCFKCTYIIMKSPLISGAKHVFTKPFQTHQFYDYNQLLISTQACHLCSLLFDSISNHHQILRNNPPQSNPLLQVTLKTHWSWLKSELSMQLTGENNLVTSRLIPIIFESHTFENTSKHTSEDTAVDSPEDSFKAASKVLHRCKDSTATLSNELFTKINQWTSKCSSEHSRCRNRFVPIDSISHLPKRLLNVDKLLGESIRLAESQLLGENRVKYNALSHCWGDTMNSSSKLTRQRLNEMDETKSISIQSLPLTFQDAITVTRNMNLSYLWIDSLTIVQDDMEEWEQESATMGLIYANAWCVISAAGSKDSTGGLFFSRELYRRDCLLGHVNGLSILAKSAEKRSDTEVLFKDKVDKAIINSRAWTFQERYLAVRLVHFVNETVLFECNTMIASEYDTNGCDYSLRTDETSVDTVQSRDGASNWGIIGQTDREIVEEVAFCNIALSYLPSRGIVNYEFSLIPKKRRRKIGQLLEDSAAVGMRGSFHLLWTFRESNFKERVEFHGYWMDMVEQYSSRSLTRERDKLKAITGVAYFIQKNTEFKYVAGLWKEVLHFNLLWMITGTKMPRPSRSLPSWSWASVDGIVSHRLKCSKAEAEINHTLEEVRPLIFDVHTQTTEEINSIILNATMTLKGRVINPSASLRVNVLYDTSETNNDEQLFYLPILIRGVAHARSLRRVTELHGIVLKKVRDKDGIDGDDSESTAMEIISPRIEQYSRVGYFWSTKQETAAYLESEGELRTIMIV